MQFRAEEYFRASLERMEQARKLYLEGTAYALAMYCAGLAVEALLRAFRWTEDASFEGRHDLGDLLKSSRLLVIDAEFLRGKKASEAEIDRSAVEIKTAVVDITVLWHNNLRYASEASLKAYLHKLGRLRRIKGDPLKKNTLDLLEAAQRVIDRGVILWNSRTGSKAGSMKP